MDKNPFANEANCQSKQTKKKKPKRKEKNNQNKYDFIPKNKVNSSSETEIDVNGQKKKLDDLKLSEIDKTFHPDSLNKIKEERKENLPNPQNKLKNKKKSKKALFKNIAKTFNPSKSKQHLNFYPMFENPITYMDQPYNIGIPNEYHNQIFYPNMYDYIQIPQNMQQRMIPNMPIMQNQMAQGKYYYSPDPLNFIPPFLPPTPIYPPNTAKFHLNIDPQTTQTTKNTDNTLLNSNPKDEHLSKFQPSKDTPSNVNTKAFSKNSITEQFFNEGKISLPIMAFKANEKIENPGQFQNHSASLISTLPKEKEENNNNLSSFQIKPEGKNTEKKDNIINSTKISNLITDDKFVAKSSTSSLKLSEIKSQLSRIHNCVYLPELIDKILQLDVCKQEVKEIKSAFYTRNEEASIQRIEEENSFSQELKSVNNNQKLKGKALHHFENFQNDKKSEGIHIKEEEEEEEEESINHSKIIVETNNASQIRFEMNRLSGENYDAVKDNISNLMICEGDYQILADIIFSNVWKEESLADLYARLCFEIISKEGENQEAEKDHKLRKLILIGCQTIFENWVNLYGSNLSESSVEADVHKLKKCKDQRKKRIRQNTRVFGIIRFVCMLYEYNMISEFIIKDKIISKLQQLIELKNLDDHSVEIMLICKIIEICGKKLSTSEEQSKFENKDSKQGKSENNSSKLTFSEIIETLKHIMNSSNTNSTSKRVIESLIELADNNWIKTENDLTSQNENSASQLSVSSNESNNSSCEETKQNYSYLPPKMVYQPLIIEHSSKLVRKNKKPDISLSTETIIYESKELREKAITILNSFEIAFNKMNILKDLKSKGFSFTNVIASFIDAEILNSEFPNYFPIIFENIIALSISNNIFSSEDVLNGFNSYLLISEKILEEHPNLIEMFADILNNFLINNNLQISSLSIIPSDPTTGMKINQRIKLAIQLIKKLNNKENKYEETIKNQINILKNLFKMYPNFVKMTFEDFSSLIVKENLTKYII